jgi:hypothetical protein
MPVSRRPLVRLAALAAGIALGVACGAGSRATRPTKVGDDDDDGTGMIARLSRGQKPRFPAAEPRPGDGTLYGGGTYGYGGDIYGYGYGGDIYGYGAGLYGGYPGVSSSKYPSRKNPPYPTSQGYAVVAVVEPGAIEGVVTWKGARPPVKLEAQPGTDAKRCGGASSENRSLVLAPGGEVEGAVVYLVDVRAGKQPALTLGGTIDADAETCALAPHVQVAAPIGLLATVSNRGVDTALVRITTPGGSRADELSLSGRAQREVSLDQPGPWELALAGAQPGGTGDAWVYIASHPYYTVTDEKGRFRLDDVPPGEYTLAVWHEPVATGVAGAGAGAAAPTAAPRQAVPEVRAKVTVKAFEVTTKSLEIGAPTP